MLRFIVPLLALATAVEVRAQAPMLGADRITRDVLFDGTAEPVGFLGWVTVGSGGTTVMTLPQDGQLRFLDARGKLLAKRGRLGAGPGEFRLLGAHGWTGDTLWVHDSKLGRVTLFRGDGEQVGTMQGPTPLTLPGGKPGATGVVLPSLLGRLPGGGFLVRAGRAGSGAAPAWLATMRAGLAPIFLTSASGTIGGLVGGVPESDCAVSLKVGRNSAAMITPLCDPVQHAASPNGMELAIITAIAVGQGAGRFTLERWRHPGWVRTQSQHSVTLVRVDPTIRDSLRTAYIHRAPNAELAAAARTQLKIPTVYPAFRKAVLGDDQTLWLERWPNGKDGVWWEMAPGSAAGRAVTLPRTFRGYAGGKGYLVGVEADADGIESIVRYRFR